MKTKPILSLCGASSSRQSNLIFAAALVALLGSPSARAADITWSGLTSQALNVSGNWVGSPTLAPATDVWVFGAAGPGGSTLTNPGNMAGMTFNAGAPAYVLGTTANNITWNVTSSNITNNSGNVQTLNMGLAMAQARNFTGSGSFIVNGALTGGGNISKKGTGNLTITGTANTLSNNFNVSENGTLTLGAVGNVGAKNVGSGAGGNFSITNATLAAAPGVVTSGGNSSIQRLTMNNGSRLTMADGVFNTFEVTSTTDLYKVAGTAPVYTFNLGGAASADVLALSAAPAFTVAGPKIEITPVSPLTVGNSYTVVTAPGGLDSPNGFVLGTGVAVFGNTAYSLSITNSPTSTTIGVISANLAKAFYSGIQGSTLNAGTPGVSSNWLDAATGGSDTLSQPSAFTEMHFTATGATNTNIAALGQDFSAFSLNFNNNAGSVTINDSGSNKITLGAGGINVGAGSHAVNVPLELSATQNFTNSGSGLLTISGNIDASGNGLTGAGGGNLTFNGNITNLGGFVKDGTGLVTINGDISGAGGLTQNGTGLLTLNGSNSYLGATTINLGSVSIPSFTAFGSDTGAIAMGLSGASSIIYTGTGETTTRNIATAGTSASTVTISQSGTGLLKLSGNISVSTANNRIIILDGSTAGTGEISGVISDWSTPTLATTVTKIGAGTWTLSGVNTFTGPLNANAGTLILDKTGSGELAAGAKLGFAGGKLQILGKTSGATTQTVASIALNAGGSSTLTILPNGGDSTTLTITAPAPTATAAGTNLVFDTSAGTPSTAVISWNPPLVGGIIGGNFLMKDNAGIGFATVSGGIVTRFTGGTVLDAVNPTNASTDFVTNTTGTIANTVAAAQLNSLTVDTTAGNNVWDLGVGNTATLSTGGIVMTGTNNFTIGNGSLTSSSASPSRLVLNQYGTGVMTINSAIPDGLGGTTLNKLGTGTLILGGANTYTGATNLQAGTLKAGSATAFNGTGQLSMVSSAIFDLNGNNAAFTNLPNSSADNVITNTGSADVTLSFSALTSTNSALVTEGANKLAITFTNNNASANLFKLDSPNTFSGGITLTGGNTRLRVTGGNIVSTGSPGAIVSSPFGKGPINLGSPAIGATDKGGLMFDSLSGTNTVLNEIIFNTELGTDNKGIRVNATASNLTLAGDITASLADAVFSGDGDLTVSGSIKGSFGLEIGGTDNTTRTVTLTAASNPYNGDTSILKGTLSVSSIANQLGTATTPIAMGATGAEVGAARLRYTGSGETTSRGVITSGVLGNTATIQQAGTGLLKFTGDFPVATNNNRNLILDGSTAGSGEISGVISNATGYTTQVTKNGTGTWTLSGANTYTNNTVVNSGALVLASTGRLTLKTGAISGTGNNVITGAGTVILDGSFVIDTTATDASSLTSGSWQIENAASLPGAYGGSFTVVGWTDAGSDTWTKSVGLKNYTFDETTGTVSMVEVSGDAYTTWIDSYTPNALLPDAASKLPTADPDGDGLNNLLEFTLGGSPVVSSQSIRPTQTVNSTDIILAFKRSDASESPATTQTVQISTDLVDWTTIPAIPIGPISDMPTGVTVTEGVNPTDPDDITVTIPRSGSLKKFVRLNVVK